MCQIVLGHTPGTRLHTGRLRKRDNFLTEEVGKGVGEEPNHTTVKKAWSSVIHSLLSGYSSAPVSNTTQIKLSNQVKVKTHMSNRKLV